MLTCEIRVQLDEFEPYILLGKWQRSTMAEIWKCAYVQVEDLLKDGNTVYGVIVHPI